MASLMHSTARSGTNGRVGGHRRFRETEAVEGIRDESAAWLAMGRLGSIVRIPTVRLV
jgi:hypothetical protein